MTKVRSVAAICGWRQTPLEPNRQTVWCRESLVWEVTLLFRCGETAGFTQMLKSTGHGRLSALDSHVIL
jgi:hypothetical protein